MSASIARWRRRDCNECDASNKSTSRLPLGQFVQWNFNRGRPGKNWKPSWPTTLKPAPSTRDTWVCMPVSTPRQARCWKRRLPRRQSGRFCVLSHYARSPAGAHMSSQPGSRRWRHGRCASITSEAPESRQAESAKASSADAQAFVARITGTHNCRWNQRDGEETIGFGSILPAGRRLGLSEGLAEITFNDGQRCCSRGLPSSSLAPPASSIWNRPAGCDRPVRRARVSHPYGRDRRLRWYGEFRSCCAKFRRVRAPRLQWDVNGTIARFPWQCQGATRIGRRRSCPHQSRFDQRD